MSQPYYVLEIKDAAGQAERHEVSEPVVMLGRSTKRAQILVNDAKASGAHAELRFQGGKLTVTDQNSTNGTFVDNRRAQQPFVVAPNGSFKIGDSTLRLVAVFGVPEEPAARTVMGGMPLDESTRALSIDDLDALRGAGLPPARPEPAHAPVEATQALDLDRPGYEIPRRPEPGEVRYSRSEERFEGPPRRGPEPLAPDPRGLMADPRLVGAKPDRTMAFDRSSVEVGDYDHSWQAPKGSEEAPADDWAQNAKAEAAEEAEAPRRRGPTGLVRTLAVVIALYSAGLGTYISLAPGILDSIHSRHWARACGIE